MNTQEDKKPRVTVMGEAMDYDEVAGTGAVEIEDHFKPVRLSPLAINQASRIVPPEHWEQLGLYAWLQKRADHVFSKLAVSRTEGYFGKLKYTFEYDAEGPVLKTVSL